MSVMFPNFILGGIVLTFVVYLGTQNLIVSALSGFLFSGVAWIIAHNIAKEQNTV